MGCDLMWGQLALLGAGKLFQNYLRSCSHLRSGRWGQTLVKHPKAFQFQGSPPIKHNRGVAFHSERPCSEGCVNTLPPAGHSWDGHKLGSGLR